MTNPLARRKLQRLTLRGIDDLLERGAVLPVRLIAYRVAHTAERRDPIEHFAAERGTHTPGRKSATINAVNEYQDELANAYDEWSAQLAADLAKAKSDEERRKAIEDALALLLLLLVSLGRKSLTDAWTLALDGNPPTPDMVGELQDAILENEQYLGTSLIPDLRDKLLNGLRDPDIMAALALGAASFSAAISGLLSTMAARVESYSAAHWALMMMITGLVIDELGNKCIAWLDPRADHCDECPQFHDVGGREYASFQDYLNTTGGRVPTQFACHTGCRCKVTDGGGKVIAGNVRGYIGAGSTPGFSDKSRADKFYNPNHDEQGRFAEGGGSGGGGASGAGGKVKYSTDEDDSRASSDSIKKQVESGNLAISHLDGIEEVYVTSEDLAGFDHPATLKALGEYNMDTNVISISTDQDAINTYSVYHEVGHHVHLAKLSAEATVEWDGISRNGKGCRISAYGRTNAGEHFAEAYRMYARKETRDTLAAQEPDTYQFMKRVFRGDGLLPPGHLWPKQWRLGRYDRSK